MPAPGGDDRVTPTDVVRLVVSKYQLPADVCWSHTVADLLLMMQPPESRTTTTDNPLEQRIILADLDRRLSLLDTLTLEERIELADWKQQLM